MDVIELLENDHRRIETLFSEIETSGPSARQELFYQLSLALEWHAFAEEVVIYPKAEQLGETKDFVRRAYRQHDLARHLIARLEILTVEEEEWRENIRLLRQEVKNHLTEEEGDLFPRLRKLLTPAQLDEMAHETERCKLQFDEVG